MPTLQHQLQQLQTALLTIYPHTEARALTLWTLEYATTYSRVQLLSCLNEQPTNQQQQTINDISDQLLQHKPIQYIIGEAPFFGLTLNVSPDVLIPRPETEELVDWIQQTIKTQFTPNQTIALLDIGTGSGCIAVALNQILPNLAVTATDISRNALAIAQLNAQKYHQTIQFICADILDTNQYSLFNTYDIIVSNPPYIADNEKDTLDANVLNYEPHLALFAPANNVLLFYDAILQFAQQHLNPNGWLFFEIHQNYAQETANLAEEHGFCNTQIKLDINGNARMIRCAR